MAQHLGQGLDVAIRARAELGEGPTWDPAAGRLIWVDILGSRVHSHDPAGGTDTVLPVEQHVGAAKPRAGGGLVVNLRDGIGLYEPDGTGFRWLHREVVPGRRANDAAVAPDGSLWAGSMRYDQATGGGTLIRVDADGTVHTLLPEVTVSNGLGWSPDGGRVYYVDSPTQRIDVLTFSDDGEVRRAPLVDTSAMLGDPDGLTVDADGCVWVAFWGGGAVLRYTPAGELDRTVPVPVSQPTACAFGGADLTDLYITTAATGTDPAAEPLAGSVLVLPGAGSGLPQPAFAG
ncbi:SMP-30/gluconolactonase/LRE family protein [Streptomyces xiamenensis]